MLLSRFEYQYNSSHPRVPILFSTLLCGGSAPRIKRNWAKFGTSDLFYLMPKNSFIGVLGIEWLRLIRLLFHGHLRSVMCFFFFPFWQQVLLSVPFFSAFPSAMQCFCIPCAISQPYLCYWSCRGQWVMMPGAWDGYSKLFLWSCLIEWYEELPMAHRP